MAKAIVTIDIAGNCSYESIDTDFTLADSSTEALNLPSVIAAPMSSDAQTVNAGDVDEAGGGYSKRDAC